MQKISFCERYMLTTAVLERLKTNTRRLEKALERAVADYEKQFGEPFEIITQYWDEKRKKVCCLTKHGIIHVGTRYKLNEVVAVAQSYSTILNELEDPRNFECMEQWEASSATRALYAEFLLMEDCPGWTNKMFVSPTKMIHQIQITDINIERLQDITDEDCIKEGIYVNPNPPKWREYDPYEPWPPYVKPYKFTTIKGFCKPQFAFAYLIDAVSGKGIWKSNPFVVVYEFKLVK